MIQGFPSDFSGFDKNAEVLNDLFLPGKFTDGRRADGILKCQVGHCQISLITIQVGVRHAVNLTRGAGNRVKNILPNIIVYTNNTPLSLSC